MIVENGVVRDQEKKSFELGRSHGQKRVIIRRLVVRGEKIGGAMTRTTRTELIERKGGFESPRVSAEGEECIPADKEVELKTDGGGRLVLVGARW